AQLPGLLAGVRCDRGRGYADFDAARDPRAPFGLAALVSGDTDRPPQTGSSLAHVLAPTTFWPRPAATPIGSRFVVQTWLEEHVERGRTLWLAPYDGDMLLAADLPAVPDPEALFELLDAAPAQHRSMTAHYK